MTSKLAATLIGGCLAVNAAWAGTQLEDAISNCNAINCGAMTFRGVHQTNEPFVVQVFAAEGECLRLDVVTETADTSLIILSPAVLAFGGNDDREPTDTRPLFFDDPMPATGWYTVAISYWDWAPTTAKFILKYGRYPTGNPNCPVVPAADSAKFNRLGGDSLKVPASASPASNVQQ